MSKDKKKITFVPTMTPYEGLLTPPEPASWHVPEWYRGLAKFERSNSEKDLHPVNMIGTDGAAVATKQCPPFLDAMTAGYMYVLEDDLLVEIGDDGQPILSWKKNMLLIDQRPTIELPVPEGCHPIHYGFKMNWYYETPPGHSVLVTHPMNRYDLPFMVQSGIIESDIWGLPVFTAFFLKKGFRGIIPKGTPIFQYIPFKRDDWEMEVDSKEKTVQKHELAAERRRIKIHGYYKWFAWRKKTFSSNNSKSKS
tara:strand:+ start:1637 stop:2392 length:756 start_codon:yes stop_codon:yes gene_type:complete